MLVFSPSPSGTVNEGLTILEQMNHTIKAQVMGQHVVIQRQNAKLLSIHWVQCGATDNFTADSERSEGLL